MSNRSYYRIFTSAASGELASYREGVARVMRRNGIEVCDHCGSVPTDEYMTVTDDSDSFNDYRLAFHQMSVSNMQCDFLQVKDLNKDMFIFNQPNQ